MKQLFSLPALLLVLAIGTAGAIVLGYYVKQNPDVLARAETAADKPQTAAPTGPLNFSPRITWNIKPEAIAEGRVRMAYQVEASAPITSIRVRLTPIVRVAGVGISEDVIDVPLYSFGRKNINWDGHMDLTKSLLAGSPVTMRVEVTDKDQRAGISEEFSVTIPERSFANPVAKSIYDLRKTLREDPSKRLEVLRALATVLQQRDHFKGQNLMLLTLRSAAVRIALDKSDDGLMSALNLLWHAAILFEENTVRVAVKF